MIFRKEKEHGVLTEEEILDMARDIAENDIKTPRLIQFNYSSAEFAA